MSRRRAIGAPRGVAGVIALAVAVAIAVLVTVVLGAAPRAGGATDAGTRPTGQVGTGPATACGGYRAPVDGAVIDPFRLPNGPYAAGNRGLEYDTAPGEPALAIGAGEVTFAGPVARRLSVSIRHVDGRISSLSGLSSVVVVRGELVARGSVVGTTGESTHLGVREDGRYVDPALLLCGGRRRAVLMPTRPCTGCRGSVADE